jgi:hypothetical protein
MILHTTFLNWAHIYPTKPQAAKEHLGFYETDHLHFTVKEQRNLIREQKIRADSLRRATRERNNAESLSSAFAARSKQRGIYRQIGDFYESRRALVAAIDAIFE